jgi:hypothetical protein
VTRKSPVLLLVALWLAGVGPAGARPARVDLRPDQTPIRAQFGNNCFIHATVAAMEAEYKRRGYGELDLSEHFSDYGGSLFFLETCRMDGRYRTRDPRVRSPQEPESNPAVDRAPTVESGKPGLLFGLPEEKYFPVRRNLLSLQPIADANNPYWKNQYHVDTFNLDPRRLPLSALIAPRYYQIKSVTWLPREDAAHADALEAVLAAGHEVIWDFKMAGDSSADVWRYTTPADPMGEGHRMLLVGYDRTDPAHPFFIVKNSWGPTRTPGANGFTYIAYEFIRYGLWAHYITALEPPFAWHQLRYLGRWALSFADHRGTLDLYHLPGLMQREFDENGYRDERDQPLQDRRLGTFFEDGDAAKPIRVNGRAGKDALELWLDFGQQLTRWDLLRGWHITLKLRAADLLTMAGDALSPSGRRSAASAQRNTTSNVVGPDDPPIEVQTEQDRALAAKHAARRADDERRAALARKATKDEAPPAPSTGTEAIAKKYAELGGASGFLGAAQTGEQTCPDGIGRYVHYAGGSLYWSPATGAHAIYGAIRDKWAALGWERCAALGYPTTDEADAPGGGRFNNFEHGSAIYWHPDLGAAALWGEPFIIWMKNDGPRGPLGYPVADVATNGPDGLWTARFRGGAATWHPHRGADLRLDDKR